MNTNNSASRLLRILLDGQQIPQQTNCREAWHKLLSVDKNNHSLLMSRLGKVMELPNQIINDIKTFYPNQGNTHGHWSSNVNKGFMQQNLNSPWSGFIAHIDTHTITYLKISVDLLDAKDNIKMLTSEEIAEIRKKLDDIIQEIIKLDLDEDFKKNIIKYLQKIITSLDEYRITGVTPVLESIESTLGHVFIDEKYRNELTKTEFGKKIIKTLSTVADVVTVSIGLPAIASSVTKFLLTE